MHQPIFLKRRLKEPDFELTKPSTGQEYNTPRAHTHAHRWGYQLTIPAQGRAKRLLHKKRTTTLNRELEALGSSSRTNEEQRKPPANITGIPTN
jgi:hypothetical protein